MSEKGKRVLSLVPQELRKAEHEPKEDVATRQSRQQREKAERIIAISQAQKMLEEAKRLLKVLPQGHNSTLDADLLDGLHAAEIIAQAVARASKKVAQKFRVTGGGAAGFNPSGSSIGDFGTKDHDLVDGLLDDDHTQYPLLLGRAGGQTLIGGTASGDDLTLTSTSHATKGPVIIQDGIQDFGVGATLPRLKNVAGTLQLLRQNETWYVPFSCGTLNAYGNPRIHGTIYPSADNTYYVGLAGKYWAGARIYRLVLKPMTAPAAPAEGWTYYDSVAKKLKVYNGVGWETITSA